MKLEKYNIFFDSPTGLLPGSLDLCETDAGFSGHIDVLGHGTTIKRGMFDGDHRIFAGMIWYRDQEMPFQAKGALADGMLELDVVIGDRSFALTGFPVE